MIDIINPIDCMGCNACTMICPKDCISMPIDKEGFFYPLVDKETCIECGLCTKVCPIITNKESRSDLLNKPLTYGAYHRNHETRVDSTSGGLFSAIAERFFEEGGYVAGAVYNDDYSVSHIVTDDPSKLSELRSSKYLQSFTNTLFRDVKRLLREDKKVLVCATPCQISALHSYLGKDYVNLTTLDFICRGVNSPKVFQKYMSMLESDYKSKPKQIKFKDKTYGWHRFSMRVDFENGTRYCKDRYTDSFFVGYLRTGNFARPSCYECKFKGTDRKSDMTLADFWGIEKIDPSMDQNLGTSLVLVNTEKGKRILNNIQDKLIIKEYSFEEGVAGNPAYWTSMKPGKIDRTTFFDYVDKHSFRETANRFFPPLTVMDKIKSRLSFIKGFKSIIVNCGLSYSAWSSFVRLNCFSNKVRQKRRFLFRPLSNSIIQIDNDGVLELNAPLTVGVKQVRKSRKETRVLIERSAKMIVNGSFSIYTDSYIRVVKGGELTLSDGFINEGVEITCASKISIGRGCTIARDVVIRDYDAHEIFADGYQVAKPIHIGNHVWIGNRAIILKGVTVGDGAIIAAGAIVTSDIPSNSIAAGIPAKVIRTNVKWR